MEMWKRIAVAALIILLIYTVLPLTVIDILGKFALGWMIMDIINMRFDR